MFSWINTSKFVHRCRPFRQSSSWMPARHLGRNRQRWSSSSNIVCRRGNDEPSMINDFIDLRKNNRLDTSNSQLKWAEYSRNVLRWPVELRRITMFCSLAVWSASLLQFSTFLYEWNTSRTSRKGTPPASKLWIDWRKCDRYHRNRSNSIRDADLASSQYFMCFFINFSNKPFLRDCDVEVPVRAEFFF